MYDMEEDWNNCVQEYTKQHMKKKKEKTGS